ncbi:uncharacterized protein LOC135810256 [Sycon ciliatum]|uniref:uncharacterized protein LOC135810256 n=1 Tax=Sycon ciliatum TaxID=27933 RepID=UPI0020A8B9C8|eukprot:scpid94303/ scgid29090/ 
MASLLRGLRMAARPGLQAVSRNSARRSLHGQRENHAANEYVERPRWLTLLLKPLFVKEGQNVPTHTIVCRALYMYGVTLFIVGYVAFWFKLHCEWPALWEKRQKVFDEYLREEQEEVRKAKLITEKSK